MVNMPFCERTKNRSNLTAIQISYTQRGIFHFLVQQCAVPIRDSARSSDLLSTHFCIKIQFPQGSGTDVITKVQETVTNV